MNQLAIDIPRLGVERLPDLKPHSKDSNLYLYHPPAASSGLNIVLAIDRFKDDDSDDEEIICVFANAGTPDDMARWAKKQYFDYDPILATPFEPETENWQETLNRARQKDFQAWTQFLHPRQRYLAEKSWSGPAQIRGSAGTGKTVIGLHYAANLAQRYPEEKILYTTKRSLLNQQFKERFHRLQPGSDLVEFQHLDRLAYDLAVPKGTREREEQEKIFSDKEKEAKFIERREQAFEQAYESVISETELRVLGSRYLKDEIELVILGNGFSGEDEYTNERRAGRFPLSDEQRSLIWKLHETCKEELEKILAETGTPHTRYADNLLKARDIARAMSKGQYRSVIVDEALDFNLVGMQLIRALVAGSEKNPLPEDSILVLSSAAQQIYPGGYRLAEAGIEIEDRDCLLYTNYRNAGVIHKTAMAVRGTHLVSSPSVNSNDDELEVSTEFEGESRPRFIRVASFEAEMDFIHGEIARLLEQVGYEESEIAILVRHEKDIEKIDDSLDPKIKKGFALSRIKSYREGLDDGVRIGTFEYAKGLEFRAVFIPCMAERHNSTTETGTYQNQTEDNASIRELKLKEESVLEQGQLYAAMTRARDRLYLIADDEPNEDLWNARSKFDWQDRTRG